MRYVLLLSALIAACAIPTMAQRSFGYGFIGGTVGGPGKDGAFRYGLGVEAYVAPRFTLGGEVGGIGAHGVLGSGNVSYHVHTATRELDPFVTGGISGAWLHGSTGAYVNLGGGFNYWFRRTLGLRGEFRAYPGGGDLNSFAEFRLGITFR
jgi:hypothetical protein